MGYLDDDEYDDNSDNPILSEEWRKRQLLGIHAPDLYPELNDPGNGRAMDGRPSYIDEEPTGGGAEGTFDSGRRAASIYEPGPSEAAYGEALRKPRPEYQAPGSPGSSIKELPWWKTLLEIAVPGTRAVFANPYRQARQDYERRTGAYEGEIAQKRGAASLEIGERDRQQKGILDQTKEERDIELNRKRIEALQKQEDYYGRPQKKSDYEIFKEEPEPFTAYLKAKEKPDQSLSDYQYWKVDNPNGTYAQFLDFKERTTHKYDRAAGGAGGVADAKALAKSKQANENWKEDQLLKLKEQAKSDYRLRRPEARRQAKQDIQDAYENRMEAAGHNVTHYRYPPEDEPEKPKPAEQPGMMSRATSAVGSMLGGGGGAKPQITPEQAAEELRRRRGQ